jgi:hypothetical protein
MNIKESVNEVLKKIGLKAEEIQLAQMMLTDGVTTLEAEAFEAGFPVNIVAEDQLIPLPVGEYELEDGRILVVAEEGMIAEVREAAAPEEEAPEAEVPVAATEAPASEPERVAKRVIESIVKETQFSAEVEALKEEIVALKAEIETLKNVELSAPATTPIVHNPEPVELAKVDPKKMTSKGRLTEALNNLKK